MLVKAATGIGKPTFAAKLMRCPVILNWIIQHFAKFMGEIESCFDGSGRNITMHYNDVIMSAMASQITILTIVYLMVYSDMSCFVWTLLTINAAGVPKLISVLLIEFIHLEKSNNFHCSKGKYWLNIFVSSFRKKYIKWDSMQQAIKPTMICSLFTATDETQFLWTNWCWKE